MEQILPTNTETRLDYVLQFKLWSQVKIQDTSSSKSFYDSCWEFQGDTTEFGHGRVSHRGHSYYAHRLAYEFAHGPIPESLVIRHFVCNNPRCANPLHLRTGTTQDNNLDMLVHGRNPKGETHGLAKIDNLTVRQMRWLHQDCGRVDNSVVAIAARFGQSEVVTRYVLRRVTWKDVPDDFDNLTPKPDPLTPEELKRASHNNVGGSDLRDKTVQQIRCLSALGAKGSTLMTKFKLSSGSVSMIISRKTWGDVPDAKPEDVLTPEEIAEAVAEKERGVVRSQIKKGGVLDADRVIEIKKYIASDPRSYGWVGRASAHFGVASHIIQQIAQGKSWTHVKLPDDFVPTMRQEVDSVARGRKQADYVADETVQRIRAMRKAGFTCSTLSKKFGVNVSTISQMCSGKTYTGVRDIAVELSAEDVAEAENEKKKTFQTAQFTDEQVREIKHLLATTPPHYGWMAKIARRYGVELHIIQFIHGGRNYKHITGAPAVTPDPLSTPTLANPASLPQSP